MFERIKIAWQIIRNRKRFLLFMMDGGKVTMVSNLDPNELFRFTANYQMSMERYEA